MMGVKSVHNSVGNGDFGGVRSARAGTTSANHGPAIDGKQPLIFGFLGICALLCLFSLTHAQETDAGRQGGNLDHLMSSYQSQRPKINRLSTAWRGKNGTLTVGNDWSNFPDFLRPLHDYSPLYDDPKTSEQVTWAGGSGFSIAVEEPTDESEVVSGRVESLQGLTEGSPNLILSWQGEFADQGRYKVSALGRKLDLNGVHNGVAVDDEELGWGVQLAGSWRFGDLFAALRVTLGNGIDSLILKRFGSDVAVSSSGDAETLESFTILPSLNYAIDKRSDLHFSLGRYKSRDGEEATGIDTLDTVNLGYTWNPWPSASIGVEVVGKDFEGDIRGEDATEIKIGAKQRF